MLSSIAYAQAATGQQPNFIEQMVPFALIFLIIFFLFIRPTQKRQKVHAGFLGSLKRGDEVLTSGGIMGTIEGLTDQFVTLEVSDGVRIRILKSQISSSAKEEAK